MKLFAVFIILLLGFLTVEPLGLYVEEGNSCCTESGCSMELPVDNDEGNKESGCDMAVCNPFMSCIYGNYFLNVSKEQNNFNFITLANRFEMVNDERSIHQPRDCFHPPEYSLNTQV